MAGNRHPCPQCQGSLIRHCAVGKACWWVRCRRCNLIIDPRKWRAYHSQTGLPVALPPTKT